jgi:proteasome lid subunit RPN8/RPN11
MTSPAVASKFATWSAPGHDFRIEYSAVVLDEIRQTAVEGYHRVPHGGVETGGVLFGTHEENTVRIQAWRPIDCQYSKGPSFLLSENEEAALAEALEGWRGEAALDGLEPVGWYRAHTRSEVFLADADLAFFHRFFPQPWQTGLIVRPSSFAPTRAGFFFREADGGIRAESSYHEFTLIPIAADQAALAVAAAAMAKAATGTGLPESAPQAALVRTTQATTAIAPHRALEFRPPLRHGSGGSWKWYAVGLGVLAFAILALWLLKPSPQGLKLSAMDTGGQLRIAWDGAAGPIARARSGWIEIDDHGVRTHVNLTPADLRSGSVFYARQSGDVAVRLTVDSAGGAPFAESTRFLKPGESGPPPSGPPPALPVDAQEKAQPPRQPAVEQARVEAQPVAIEPAAPVSLAKPGVAFRAPKAAVRLPSPDLPAIPPPEIDSPAAAPPAGLTSVVIPVAPPTAPAAQPRPAATVPASVTVASGRITWVGKFPKNGRLVIEHDHASAGALTGALPAVKARVSVYPGDLGSSGLTLFTADPRYAQPLSEKAGAENGGHPTTYTWDPKRAAGVQVLEQPGPQNGYKLVLESSIPKLSVVVLEWRATR